MSCSFEGGELGFEDGPTGTEPLEAIQRHPGGKAMSSGARQWAHPPLGRSSIASLASRRCSRSPGHRLCPVKAAAWGSCRSLCNQGAFHLRLPAAGRHRGCNGIPGRCRPLFQSQARSLSAFFLCEPERLPCLGVYHFLKFPGLKAVHLSVLLAHMAGCRVLYLLPHFKILFIHSPMIKWILRSCQL